MGFLLPQIIVFLGSPDPSTCLLYGLARPQPPQSMASAKPHTSALSTAKRSDLCCVCVKDSVRVHMSQVFVCAYTFVCVCMCACVCVC